MKCKAYKMHHNIHEVPLQHLVRGVFTEEILMGRIPCLNYQNLILLYEKRRAGLRELCETTGGGTQGFSACGGHKHKPGGGGGGTYFFFNIGKVTSKGFNSI
jgi:hypothetical protein